MTSSCGVINKFKSFEGLNMAAKVAQDNSYDVAVTVDMK
jgi:hypothetical protein